jgi:hypothetical protein
VQSIGEGIFTRLRSSNARAEPLRILTVIAVNFYCTQFCVFSGATMSQKKARRKARRNRSHLESELSAYDSDEALLVEQEWEAISGDFLAESDEIAVLDFRSSDGE